MANATIVSAWQDAEYAYLAVSVVEPNAGGIGVPGNVEYIGKVDKFGDDGTGAIVDKWSGLSAAQKKASLVAAAKAVRDGQATAGQALAGLSGTVVV